MINDKNNDNNSNNKHVFECAYFDVPHLPLRCRCRKWRRKAVRLRKERKKKTSNKTETKPKTHKQTASTRAQAVTRWA